MKKRVFSLLMAVTLCFSTVPMTAFAQEADTTTEQETTGAEAASETVPETSSEPQSDAAVYETDNSGEAITDISGGNAAVQDAEKTAAVKAAQELIDALPEEVTAENAETVGEQLAAIDAALENLAALDETLADELDMTRYEAVCEALTAFIAAQASGEHTHFLCGETVCNQVGGHADSEITFTKLWMDGNTLKIGNTTVGLTDIDANYIAIDDCYVLPTGNYYLEDDIILSHPLFIGDGSGTESKTVNLCLNGKTITANGSFNVIALHGEGSDVTFSLTDCQDNGKITHTSGMRGRAVSTYSYKPGTATFNMYGGKISGNNADDSNGGGISIGDATSTYNSDSAFNMYGGTICDNTTNWNGGGVYINGTAGNNFHMYGGTIESNKAAREGGGVYAYNGTIEITDGAIKNNTAGGNGGGLNIGSWPNVYFTMSGGTITGNTAATGKNGGGIYVGKYGDVTVSGEITIEDNTVDGKANNVYLTAGRLIKVASDLPDNASICVTTAKTPEKGNFTRVAVDTTNHPLTDADGKCFSPDAGSGYVIEWADGALMLKNAGDTTLHYHPICGEVCMHLKADGTPEHKSVYWEGVSTLSREEEHDMPAGYYYLTGDVTLANYWKPEDKVALDLNGHNVTMQADLTQVIALSGVGATFTLTDCRGGNPNHDYGEITHGIKANGERYTGQGIMSTYGGYSFTFNMYGGRIANNTATTTDSNGGGVCFKYAPAGDKKIFNMYGGEIVNNTSAISYGGGGVYMKADPNTNSSCDFNMYGGTISGNKTTAANSGAGVNLEEGSTFTMVGGEISGNTAAGSRSGGGVRVTSDAAMAVGNEAKITGNKGADDADSNVYLPADNTIAVIKAFTDTAKIGVTTEDIIKDSHAVIAKSTDAYTLTKTDLKFFSSDAEYESKLTGDSIVFADGELHEHSICGAENCGDAGHATEAWKAISDLSDIDGNGSYYLKKDVTLTSTWTCNYNVKLCLNGKTITASTTDSTIQVAKEYSLDITDCRKEIGAITHEAGKTGEGLLVWGGGTCTLWNGAITGNNGTSAVYVDDIGSFKMNGGSITGNQGEYSGGVFTRGTFEMNGGSITENTSSYSSGDGGGVGVASKGTFTMTGGEIADNTGNRSGGVYAGGTFTMTGGNITRNINGTNNAGGGVYVADGGKFNLAGDGSITGNKNTSSFGGGGVYVAKGGTFNMKGGDITSNVNTSSNSGGGVYVAKDGAFTMDGGAITGNENSSTYYSGGGVYINSGIFTMNDGKITGNTSKYCGGGVYIYSSGKFNMNGGSITENTSESVGGGVYVLESSIFTMTEGKIAGNTSASYGGGVYVVGSCTTEMSGGEITGNNSTATDDAICAGGVYVGANAEFTVSGTVRIQENYKNGTLKDGVYVPGNNGAKGNLYLEGDGIEYGENYFATITIGEGLTEESRIDVSKSSDNLPTPDQNILIATGAEDSGLDYTKIFGSDVTDQNYTIGQKGSKLYLMAHQHSWNYTLSEDGVTITATCEGCGESGSITLEEPAGLGYGYDGKAKIPEIIENHWQGPATEEIVITYKTEDGTALEEAPVNAGTYVASISFKGADDETVTASVTYEIAKATPTADNFNFTTPYNLTYDGKVKTVEVGAKSGINGMGNVTVKYYQGDTVVQDPTNAGNYTVKIDVAEDTNYKAVNNLTDSNWQFTIAANISEPIVELNGNTSYIYTGQSIKPEVTVKVDGVTLVKDKDYTIAYGTNVNAGENAGTVTITAKGNYAFDNVEKSFTIEKAAQVLSFTKDTVTKTYIDQAFTNALIHTKGDGAVTYASDNTDVATVDESTGKITIVGVGETTITATAAETQNYNKASASYTLTVGKALIYFEPTVVEDKIYDGTKNARVTVSLYYYDENRDKVMLELTKDRDYNVTGTFSSENVGEHTVNVKVTLIGDCAKKYNLNRDNYDVMRTTISPRTISIGSVNVESRSYDKSNTSVTISNVTFTNTIDGTLTEGKDYTVTGKMADENAGEDKAVTVTVNLLNGNYSLSDNTVTTKVTIHKAAGGTLTGDNLQQKYSDHTTKTFAPEYGLPAGEKWTYSISDAAITGSAKLESAAVIDPATGAITYRLTDGAENDKISWTVTITNPNYENFTKELVLTLTARDPQETLHITGDTTVVYGQTLKLGTIGGSGTGKVTYRIDKDKSTGDATIDANGILTPVKVGSVVITATKAGDVDYSDATSAPFEITITKATPTGEPKYTLITTDSKTLADAGLTLTGSTLRPLDGTLQWEDETGKVLSGDTEVKANTIYQWRFIPADTNYNTLTGKVELYHVDAPAISAQPESVSVITGEKATFEVTATGTNVTYQWKIDRNDGKGFVDITGATDASYTTGVTDKDCDGFKYQCVISNAAGSVTTDTVILTVREKFIITVTAGEHGSISPNGAVEVVEGSKQTFVITPDDGYEIASLTVDGTVISAVASYTFENVTAEHTIAVTFKLQYKIIDGENSSWTQNTDGNGSIRIRGNGEFSKFLNVKVDGTIVDPANYIASEGSTIIELKADYLKTLSEGSHTFEIAWKDGTASTSFTVAKNTSGNDDNDSDNDNNSSNNNGGNNIASSNNTVSNTAQTLTRSPNTGDASGIWITLFGASIAGLAVMLARRKK